MTSTHSTDRLAASLADRYRIERELGAGRMATVYLAHDLKHDRKVALKVLRPELSAVIGADRFLVEIKTTANLQHPHILALYDSGQVDGTVFYVMPFVEGESLRDRLEREKQLPVGDAVRIAIEIAGALDYAHRHGVIHRDIKPENILLHDGRALVADFGIALAASRTEGSARMTETGMSLGTPHYMSPEQALGERNLDARTDVYALGCVLHEMLAGEPPFSGPNAQAIIARVMSSEPEPVTYLRKTVPEHVADAILTALSKLPADRFASAAEFATALGGGAAATTSRSATLRMTREQGCPTCTGLDVRLPRAPTFECQCSDAARLGLRELPPAAIENAAEVNSTFRLQSHQRSNCMKRFSALGLAVFVLAGCSDVPTSTPTPAASPSLNVAAGASIAGRYIVVFKGDVQDVDGEVRQLSIRHGAAVRHTYKSALKGMAIELSDAKVAALRAEPSVAYVEQDQVVSINTTQSGATWGIDRIDQRNLPLSGTYTYGADGTGVTVYIIDTGINFTHTEYAGRAFTGVDEVTVGGTAADCNGHGSHVSGTVGGTVYGVAKKVKLVAVRVLDCSGSGSNSGVIAGIDWVTANRVLPAAANMSLGGGFSASLNTAVENSIAAGVVYGIAAGNSSADACGFSPASAPSAITVGATDISDGFASFSNFGTCVDINAPGVNITSAWIGSNTATNTISGTSMATPHVVGVAALYLQVNPAATPLQARNALVSNGTPNVISSLPSGTPNTLLYSAFITAGPTPPVANFTSSCSLLSCNFDGSSSTALAGASYSWTFGDATSGSGVTTSHAYAASGTYSVSLTVTDANGTSTKTSSVTVSNAAPPPVASFTKSCSGLTCTFNASATTNATSYGWDFGDATTGTGVTVSHAFASRRSYTITLTATGAGGSSTATQTVTCNAKRCS